jgi:hypothetical protein
LLTAALFAGCGGSSSDPAGATAGAAGSSSDPAGATGGAAGPGECHAARDPKPSIPSSASLDPNAVALAAVVFGSCAPDDGVARNAAYIWAAQASSGEFFYRTQLQLDCLAHSKCGCAAMGQCFGYDYATDSDCKAGCTGDTFTACGSANDLPAGARFTVDCQSVGLRCDPVALCIDGAPTVCDPPLSSDRCNADGQLEYCDSDGLLRHGPSCPELGLNCTASGCVGQGASCTNTNSGEPEDVVLEGLGCAGTTLSACVNGKQASVDCRTKGPGFSCQHVADAYFCGLAAECTPPTPAGLDAASRCDGSVLEFCNAGRLEHVDCLSLGFTGCHIGGETYGCTPGITFE